jgi:hypothetical protein
MILKFPDLNTLRLALVTGAIPPAMSQAGAVVGFDDSQQCFVETSGTLPRSNAAELKKLGVLSSRNVAASNKVEVGSWAEILPLEPDRVEAMSLESTPVLFDLANGEELARMVIEMLRLGNDRQGYRWLESNEESGTHRALLRVVGPPYYSLLRAKDRIGGSLAPVAYIERGSRVWVEIGYNHPLVGQVKAPAGKLYFLRPPRQWSLVDEAQFRDVYEITEFPLPAGKVPWKDAKFEKKLKVTPSLKPGGPPEGAEFWVLRGDPVAELNRFVQNADDNLLQRLAFSVGELDGKKTIVVRVRQSKQQPPVLVFNNALAYKHYLKLTNLFLPVGTRLHPPLRRDQVRKLLAEDTSHVVWLTPGANGSFTPETLPEDSFRPLWDWIDYVLDHEKVPLQTWVQATQFDFEAFASDEDPSTKPRKPPSEPKTKGSREKANKADSSGPEIQFAPIMEELIPTEESPDLDDFSTIAKSEPSLVQKQLKALEEQFLAIDGGLDAPQRQELWPQLAALNMQLASEDGGICWTNALWERDEQAVRAWAWNWFLTEAQIVASKYDGKSSVRPWVYRVFGPNAKTRDIPAEDLDKLLNNNEPTAVDVRAFAAYICFMAVQPTPAAAFVQRLPQISRFLETNEKLLPIRSVWLAWVHLTQLSRGDILALARARDRLLERLYHSGLRPEQDLPGFLRFAGQPTTQRFRAVRQWMVDLAKSAQEWVKVESGAPATAQTGAYVDLIFAFGLARLGEVDASKELLNHARGILGTKDDAHQFLLEAFEFRIRLAQDGKGHTGALPTEKIEYLEHMDRLQRYVVDRLRKHSKILEPDQRINPYRHWGARISDFEKALADLADLTDKTEIANRIDKMLKDTTKGPKGSEPRVRILRTALEVAPRVGEDFARKILDQMLPVYDAMPEVKEIQQVMDQAAFLEKALFLAGHFGRVESIHPLVTRFQKMLQSQKGPQSLDALDSLAASCFRGLRKLGMRDEIDAILRQMADLVLEGQDVKTIDFKKRDKGIAALKTLLQVAGGWYFFARDSQADPILQAARATLLSSDMTPKDQTGLACSYAAAVGQAPVEVAQKRLEEIFDKQKGIKGVKDTYTTASHFSVSQLDVVESVVMAVVSDDFTMGTQARRWLDDDEYLVRRRIHRDLRTVMDRQ